MHPENKTILEVLKREGFTQARIYEAMGLKQGSWQRKIGSNNPPTNEFLKQIQDITGLSQAELRGSGLPKPPTFSIDPAGQAEAERIKTTPPEQLSDREFLSMIFMDTRQRLRDLSDRCDTLEGLLRTVLARTKE